MLRHVGRHISTSFPTLAVHPSFGINQVLFGFRIYHPNTVFSLCCLQPEQIRQCLVDYASINVWQLEGGTEEAPGISLVAA